MFKKFFEFSVMIFLINVLSIAFKDIFLDGEKTTTMNNVLLVLTVLSTISIILTTYSYIANRNKEETKNYKGLFFTVLITLPFVWLIVGYTITSALPYILK
ncbi:hypothetical protein [Staphylococcus epidermidis]|uniref:hypothetical protein n=1 Tax=Staphylococcus epidermidis TaxID=1282 RepID=UPI000E05F0DC|nr:hypothetical protein [Staphylococcus epidermidis]SUM23265.1 Uncharacterised protein [Staphylococcus epidermidis]